MYGAQEAKKADEAKKAEEIKAAELEEAGVAGDGVLLNANEVNVSCIGGTCRVVLMM